MEEAPERGLIARAIGKSIFTQADTTEALHRQIRDAVHSHFDKGTAPELIRLHCEGERRIELPFPCKGEGGGVGDRPARLGGAPARGGEPRYAPVTPRPGPPSPSASASAVNGRGS